MKKIFALVLVISLVIGTSSFVYADRANKSPGFDV